MAVVLVQVMVLIVVVEVTLSGVHGGGGVESLMLRVYHKAPAKVLMLFPISPLGIPGFYRSCVLELQVYFAS